MIIALELQLVPTPEQAAILRRTIRQFNRAVNHAAQAGFAEGSFGRCSIHHRCYRALRDQYGLSAQMTCHAIGKAVEVFRRDKSRCPSFRLNGNVTYDSRTVRLRDDSTVSIDTLAGRQLIAFVCGTYQRARLSKVLAESDLVERRGKFYLLASIRIHVEPIQPASDFLGVDLGIAKLATDSDGTAYSGDQIERIRRRHHRTRKRLQRHGTRGAKRRLKAIAGREGRFRRHTNHCISKALVARAKGTDRGIALEDLTGIRERTTVRSRQRNRHSGWAFRQLRSFIEYKAQMAGVETLAVDPRNTSRTCSECGHCDPKNRRSQSEFQCRSCNHSMNADLNAALNVRAWALRKRASELTSGAAA